MIIIMFVHELKQLNDRVYSLPLHSFDVEIRIVFGNCLKHIFYTNSRTFVAIFDIR